MTCYLCHKPTDKPRTMTRYRKSYSLCPDCWQLVGQPYDRTPALTHGWIAFVRALGGKLDWDATCVSESARLSGVPVPFRRQYGAR